MTYQYECDCGRRFFDHASLSLCQSTNHGVKAKTEAEAENDEPSCIRLEPQNNNGPDGTPSIYRIVYTYNDVVLGQFYTEVDGSWVFYTEKSTWGAWTWPVLKAIATELERLDRAAAEEMGTPF